MSTEFKDRAGDVIALRYFDGQRRGAVLQCYMPQSIRTQFGHLIATQCPGGYEQSLNDLIDEVIIAGGDVVFITPGGKTELRPAELVEEIVQPVAK